MKKFIVWIGKMDTFGMVWPRTSLGLADTIEEATAKAMEWQHNTRDCRRSSGPCVITTTGAQKIVAGVPDLSGQA